MTTSLLRTYWLSFHAAYACRHSGACCSAGWDIPIERARVPAVRAAIERTVIAAPVHWLRELDDAPDDIAGTLALGDDRRCIFHRDPGCAIHGALGHEALPASCQHFPRIALIDRRGVFVTLSHFCPTAAALLIDAPAGNVTIVEGPAARADNAVPEGLDAREALPPSRSPAMLMDWEGYGTWERDAVTVLTSGTAADEALAMLDERVGRIADATLYEAAVGSVPSPYTWPSLDVPLRREAASVAPVVGRFLAAHLFGSWMAYQGNGLLATVLSLRTALVVLRAEMARAATLVDAIRQSDLLLRHLIDRQALAAALSRLAAR